MPRGRLPGDIVLRPLGPRPWLDDAACARPDAPDMCSIDTALEAEAVCARCPVAAPCRRWQQDQAPHARAFGVVAGERWLTFNAVGHPRTTSTGRRGRPRKVPA